MPRLELPFARVILSHLGARPAAICLLLGAGLAAPAAGQTRFWAYDGNGFWSEGAKWSPNGSPLAHETASVGFLPDTQHRTVWLDGNTTVHELRIHDGSQVRTQGNRLTVTDLAYIAGEFERFGVTRSARLSIVNGPAAIDFETDGLAVFDSGEFALEGGAVARVNDFINIERDAYLFGPGRIDLTDDQDRSLFNEGTIYVHAGDLEINQLGAGPLDLDGNGTGKIYFNPISSGDLTINAAALWDSFSGSIFMEHPGVLEMNIAGGWEADELSRIHVDAYMGPGARIIRGEELTLAGELELMYGQPHLRIEAPAILEDSATVLVDEDGLLEFTGETTIRGGAMTLGDGAIVRFEGPTEWRGDAQLDGVVRQLGDAIVTGTTIIDAAVFDLDGAGSTSWTIHAPTVINADSIDYLAPDYFDGEMSIAGGFTGALTLNLSGYDAPWAMAGELSLIGDASFMVRRLGGSPILVTGDVEVTNKAQIVADTTLAPTSRVTFAAPSAVLQLKGESLVEAGAIFVGKGMVQAVGEMVLADGASLGPASLQSRGELRIGADAPGAAGVGRLESTPDAVWVVDIGGYTVGDEHDAITVAGDVLLDGEIEVRLVDAGGGLFLPEPGDSFGIVNAGGSVAGEFLTEPVSLAGGNIYEWRVVYRLQRVSLELDSVHECAADFNEDGLVNTLDLIAFLNAWNAGEPAGDFNRDGVVNTLDVILFFNFWTAAC